MFLDKTGTTIINGTFTKRGRQLISLGKQKFNITKFALSDSQIDYNLWNQLHPSGSAYYGEKIQNMPVLQAMPNGQQIMRYLLVTMPKDTTRLFTISVPGISNQQQLQLQFNDLTTMMQYIFKPTTANTQQTYNVTIKPNGMLYGIQYTDGFGKTIQISQQVSQMQIGFNCKSFTIIVKPYNKITTVNSTPISIIGTDTGASFKTSVSYVVNPLIEVNNS